jgi:hypothetical protein
MKVEVLKLQIRATHPLCSCCAWFDSEGPWQFVFQPCEKTEHCTQGNFNQMIDQMKRALAMELESVVVPPVKPLMSY